MKSHVLVFIWAFNIGLIVGLGLAKYWHRQIDAEEVHWYRRPLLVKESSLADPLIPIVGQIRWTQVGTPFDQLRVTNTIIGVKEGFVQMSNHLDGYIRVVSPYAFNLFYGHPINVLYTPAQ